MEVTRSRLARHHRRSVRQSHPVARRLAADFFGRSLSGGIDVARRALSPSLPVAPGFITYETRLDTNAGRVIFTWMIGMMPGSSSVNLDSRNRITVHVIDPAVSGRENLAILEEKLAAVINPD